MNVGSDPVRMAGHGNVESFQPDGRSPGLICGDSYGPPLEAKFEALHHLDGYFSRWYIQQNGPVGVKIMRFKGSLRANETVVGMYPRVVGCVGPAIFSSNGNPRRRRVSRGIEHRDRNAAHWLQIMRQKGMYGSDTSARNFLDHQTRVEALVRDERDPGSIRRPARIDRVKTAVKKKCEAFVVGQRKRISAVCGHRPQLVPLLTQVRCVDDSLAVGRKVWPSLPRCFFVVKLARFRTGFGF